MVIGVVMGWTEGRMGDVQRHGCGRRKDARRKVVLEVGRGRAVPLPTSQAARAPNWLGTWVPRSGPPGGACLTPSLSDRVGDGWNLPVTKDTVTGDALLLAGPPPYLHCKTAHGSQTHPSHDIYTIDSSTSRLIARMMRDDLPILIKAMTCNVETKG